MKKKGYVLLHVLVMAMVVAVISAGIMRMLMLRQTMIVRNTTGVTARKSAEGHLNRIMTAWNSNRGMGMPPGTVCGAVSGYSYSGAAPGTCNCSYTITETLYGINYNTVISARGGTPCGLSINATPLPFKP